MNRNARATPNAAATTCPLLLALGLLLLSMGACGDESAEPERVTLPVVVDDTGMTAVTTDLGYTVELQALRMSIVDLELTTAGEMHASDDRHWLQRLLIPSAYAHPGHYAGGDVIGELRGRWVVDWLADDGVVLGDAVLLEGDYNGANFTFGSAQLGDGLDEGDPLIGHNVELSGTATRDDATVTFHAVIDQDVGRQLVGAPFDLVVTADTEVTLGLQCLLADPVEADTLFDEIDFFALDSGSGHVELEPDTPDHNRLRRHLQVHDHYNIEAQ